MATRQIPSEEQVIGWMDSLSNWGRWGADDQMGTLNLITDAKRDQAAALVKEGISVTCSRVVELMRMLAPARAHRRVVSLSPTSTIRASPVESRWESFSESMRSSLPGGGKESSAGPG